jgi:hypothetical protein
VFWGRRKKQKRREKEMMMGGEERSLPFKWIVFREREEGGEDARRTIVSFCETLLDSEAGFLEEKMRRNPSPFAINLSRLGPCSVFIQEMVITFFETEGDEEGRIVRKREVSCPLVRILNPERRTFLSCELGKEKGGWMGTERYKVESEPSSFQAGWESERRLLPFLSWDESSLLSLLTDNMYVSSCFLYRPWQNEFGRYATKESLSSSSPRPFSTIHVVKKVFSDRRSFFLPFPPSSSVLLSFTIQQCVRDRKGLERIEYGTCPSYEDASLLLLPPPPSRFVCPITHSVMRYPCVASDGKVYEMDAILEWIGTGRLVSPCTGCPILERVYPCHSLRDEVRDWIQVKREERGLKDSDGF